jgi:hypothetical protein
MKKYLKIQISLLAKHAARWLVVPNNAGAWMKKHGMLNQLQKLH